MLPARPGRPPRNCAQQFFRGLPEAMWSPQLNAKLLELAQTKLAMYDAYISEMEQMPEDEAYLAQHEHSLGARPLRVLSTGNHGVHFLDTTRPADPQHQKYEQEVARAQAKWLELSSNAKQLFTDRSSEYIPFDQPDFVVEAIREVYSQSTSPSLPGEEPVGGRTVHMKQLRSWLILAVLISSMVASATRAQQPQPTAPRSWSKPLACSIHALATCFRRPRC